MKAVPGYILLELLQADPEFRLYRGIRKDDSLPVLIRVPASDFPSPHTLEKIEREFALRHDLSPTWAVPPLELSKDPGLPALILQDPGGEPLNRLLKRPWTLAEFLRLSVGIARSLGEMHTHRLVHKDIKPGNIMADLSTATARLTGFGISSSLPREHQSPDPPQVIAGTLPYMAPEQTGRMNRSIDSRSDLYSLGMVLYELITGSLPFSAADPMEWIHCHVARLPLPPHERVRGDPEGRQPEIPHSISDIILRLLAKTPEERYQTAEGVASDLAECLAQWETRGRIEPFPLARHDGTSRLLIPEKIYGREREIQSLQEAFNHMASQGDSELVLVSGYSGVGKSSLVSELHKMLVPPRGVFASGKFDQYNRNLPYDTFAQCLRSIVQQILAGSEEEIRQWRETVGRALAPNGRLMTDLVPELEQLIGEQPPVPEVNYREAENRILSVFRNFLGALAGKEHPLALFLDDLQWQGGASLKLLEHLATHPEMTYLLIIGAYRENEVGPSHPLRAALDSIRKAGARVLELEVQPLSRENVGQMVGDSMRSPPAEVDSLAQIVHERTGGNPFFVIQFLTALHDEGLLEFDANGAKWRWDQERIRAAGFSDNVVDIMVGKIMRLPAAALEALKACACLGHATRGATLAKVLGEPEEKVQEILWEALEAGYILRAGGFYRFAHDRMQEAAYSLIPERARAEEHLRIGRTLMQGMSEEKLEEAAFLLAAQFNQGLPLLEGREERDSVRRLNILAGRKAKAAIDYASAREYFDKAMSLLPEDPWSEYYEEAFALTLDFSKCEFLIGAHEHAEEIYRQLLEKARSRTDRIKVYRLFVRLYQVAGRYKESLATGMEALDQLGIVCPVPGEEVREATEAQFLGISVNMRGRTFADLAAAPEAIDADTRDFIGLCVDLAAPIYLLKPDFFPYLMLMCVNRSISQGPTENSAFAYFTYAGILIDMFDDVPTALELVDLAMRLNDRFNNSRLKGTLIFLNAYMVNHWARPFREGVSLYRQAIVACQEVGDLNYAGRAVDLSIWNDFETGTSIDEMLNSSAKFGDFVKRTGNEGTYHFYLMERQQLVCLKGLTPDPSSLEDGSYAESRSLEAFSRSGLHSGFALHSVLNLWLHYLYGEHDQALVHARQAEKDLTSMRASPYIPFQVFFHALALAAIHQRADGDRQREISRELAEKSRRLKTWSEHCPENFLNRYLLVSAEIARIEGRDWEAMRLYDQAIRSAGANGLIHNESLAFELAGRFYMERDMETIGRSCLRNARSGYFRWGALAKVKQLDQVWGGLEEPAPPGQAAVIGTPVEKLDLQNVLKASQAVSREIVQDKLIEKLVAIAVEQAGAEKGLLLLADNPARTQEIPHGMARTGYTIKAEAITDPNRVEVRLRNAPADPGGLPELILRQVEETLECVVLEDALFRNPFSRDPYILKARPRSVLCLPLVKQTRLLGMLYLENNLSSGVFTSDRLAILKVIASQAAISLENAGLYTHLEEERARLRAIIERIPVGLYLAEAPSGRIVEGNEQSETILRRPFTPTSDTEPYASFVGYHTDGRRYEENEWPLARAIRTGETVRDEEILMERGDGSHGWISVNAAPIQDAKGKTTAAVVIFQDIAERKRSEKDREVFLGQLRDERERLSVILNLMPVPLLLVEPGTARVRFANHAAQALSGGVFPSCARDPASGAASPCIDSQGRNLAGDGSPDLRASRGEKFVDFEFTWLHPSGPRTLLLNTEALRDPEGNPTLMVLALLDITPLKETEAQLRQSQKMEAIGRLTGGIAHDFNNLLAVINGYSSMALEGMDDSHPLFGSLREILKAGERAATLTRQLLAYSRKQVMETRIWNLNAIVEEMGGMLTRVIGEDVKLETILSPEPGWIKADRGQVEQVILNLVVNARDAMPGGGKLVIETSKVQLDAAYVKTHPEAVSGPHVGLRVTDTGTGMTPEVQARIYEPFFTTKGQGKGTGLGLPVVYGIMKQSGAQIDLYTEVGHGTTFRIFFPAAGEPKPAAPAAPRSSAPRIRGSETLLLVEDEEAVRKFVTHALESLGYKVVQAVNGRDALEGLSHPDTPIQLVLTDMVMPDMGGRELADRLRILDPDLPMIFMSGYLEQPFAKTDTEVRFLPKPFSILQMAELVRETLDRTVGVRRQP